MPQIKLPVDEYAVDDLELETRSGRLHAASIDASWDDSALATALRADNDDRDLIALVNALLADMGDSVTNEWVADHLAGMNADEITDALGHRDDLKITDVHED